MAADLPTGERTIGQLVADATHDVQHIVRGEIALAKTEMSTKAQVMGKGVGMLVGAAVLGLMGLLFVFHTLAWVLSLWLPTWAGFGIVALLLLIVAGVLGMVGVKALKTVDPAPRKAIADVQQTVAAIKPGN